MAARALLDADVPPDAAPSAASRARGAAWYLLHLLTGGVATFAVLGAVPLGVALLVWQVDRGELLRAPLGALADLHPVLAVPLALVLVVVPAYVVAGLRALLRRAAEVLLGPSAAERIAALEARQRRARRPQPPRPRAARHRRPRPDRHHLAGRRRGAGLRPRPRLRPRRPGRHRGDRPGRRRRPRPRPRPAARRRRRGGPGRRRPRPDARRRAGPGRRGAPGGRGGDRSSCRQPTALAALAPR